MFNKKELKYGYSVETAKDGQLVKPSNLTKILLTPQNSKFSFHGTRHEILKWMSTHSDLLVEYDSDNNNNVVEPPSPSPSTTSFNSPTSSVSSSSISITSKKPHDIVFDLFAIPVKTSAILSDEATFNRPLNIALKIIPWIEVMLEIRPVDESKDSKLNPLHRVILPSGTSLLEISKALDKSWKSLTPDLTAFSPDCFIKNSELLFPQKKSKLFQHDVKTNNLLVKSDNEDVNETNNEEKKLSPRSLNFMNEIAKHVPTVDLWYRNNKQTTVDTIPPGILTPYIIDDVLEDFENNKKEEEIHDNKKIFMDKQSEAELDKEAFIPDLPQYERVFGDRLLERGL